MKYLSILSVIFLFGCSGSNDESATDNSSEVQSTAEKNTFTLSGEIGGCENQMFFIETATDRGIIQIGQAKADASGKFNISSEVPGFGEYYLRMGESNSNVIPMVIVPGDEIKVKGSADNFTSASTFSGTEWSASINGFLPVYAAYSKQMNDLKSRGAGMTEYEQLVASIDARKDVEEFAFAQMEKDPGNPYNLILFKVSGPQYENFIGWDEANIDIMRAVYAAFNNKFPNSPLTRAMSMQIGQMEEMQMITSGKISAPEIALPNPEGKEMKLSDLRGKYVLIDFWASWCAPCRRENPNVIRLYNQYKDKGFTIYSVSLDEDGEKWKAAIAQDKLSWPNHVSDLKGWQTPMVQLYGFSGIPHTVLLDKQGNIIAKGLRGGTLEWKLRELLQK